ncbi:MAG: hypothetical protein K1X79_12420 [Oligoflexia bacterium]|nr:hypothetical protein [Oligoflexia bacterium]
MASNSTPQFRSREGFTFTGVTTSTLCSMQEAVRSELTVSDIQVVEAASYSMAMVVRFALGLSAAGGKVCAVVRDSLAGGVALATLRHLVNSGAQAQALLLTEDGSCSPLVAQQAEILRRMNIPIPDIGNPTDVDGFTAFLGEAHNVIFGTHASHKTADEFLVGLCDLLNEERTPVHCIEAPAGVNPDSGTAHPSALYASSTLSLGAPYTGLFNGRDYVGRHYICDTSISAGIYQRHGCAALNQLFSDQPVVQIFPIEAETA